MLLLMVSLLLPADGIDIVGHIAKLAGYPTYSRYSHPSAGADDRHVGNAMKMLPSTTDIPWQVSPEYLRASEAAGG
jgi:methylated-DNA-protein-cysteine methyltransferase-like protein